MGCDIHLYAEKRMKDKEHWDSYWSSVLDLSNSGIRDYDMFGFLANGVRFSPDEKYEPHEVNGLPDDVCFMTIRETRLRIAGKHTKAEWEDYTSKENAKLWHEYGCKYWKMCHNCETPLSYEWTEIDKLPEEDVDDIYDNDPDKPIFWVDHPDFHSHSHISLDEYKTLLFRYVDCMNELYNTEETLTETEEGFLVGTTTLYWVALYNQLHTYEQYGYEIRLVYWFDN